MNNTQKIKENKEIMRKYFEETSDKSRDQHNEFLQNWFSENSLDLPSGMEIKGKLDGDYYRCYLVSYDNMFFILSDPESGHFWYEGELTEFVNTEAQKNNTSVEDFLCMHLPYEYVYIFKNFKHALVVRSFGIVTFPDLKKNFHYFFNKEVNQHQIYSNGFPDVFATKETLLFSNQKKQITIDKLIGLVNEMIFENDQTNIVLD